MPNISVDFGTATGRIKPLHGVNNAPVRYGGRGRFQDFVEVGFPFVRTHDAALTSAYGGPHTVDILAIFPDFDADENDPASYDFHLTDEYMEHILASGAKVFYRLGNRIEHESKRYGSLPPKDYGKWARICEHIIRHMNEGWADGHRWGIEYWEIWNEPDINPQCWDGPIEDFWPLYDTAARHLKKCFPDLKIGGPGLASVYSYDGRFADGFFSYLTRNPADPAPMDFFSFHQYAFEPTLFASITAKTKEVLDRYGYGDVELILNEWNYVKGWTPDLLLPSFYTIAGLKGAAFAASSICVAQRTALDQFMYYAANYGMKFNGLFDDLSPKPLKTYFAFKTFSALYRLGTEVRSSSDSPDVYTMAAVSADGGEAAILASYYLDHPSVDGAGAEDKTVELSIDWTGFASEGGVEVEYLTLDAAHDLTVTARETFFGAAGAHIFEAPLYTTLLVRLKKR